MTGGEALFQHVGVAALLRELDARSAHVVAHSGHTLGALSRRAEPELRLALQLVDLLIDGPFVATLANGVGEWRGSRNQRLIHHPDRAIT